MTPQRTVRVDDVLWKAFLEACRREHRNPSEVLRDTIRTVAGRHFPTFEVPDNSPRLVPMCIFNGGPCQSKEQYDYCQSRDQPICGGHTQTRPSDLTAHQQYALAKLVS